MPRGTSTRIEPQANTAIINHIRFYFTAIEKYRRLLNNEQMGRLFFAIADYAQTGEYKEVEADIAFPYDEAANAIDAYNDRYSGEGLFNTIINKGASTI